MVTRFKTRRPAATPLRAAEVVQDWKVIQRTADSGQRDVLDAVLQWAQDDVPVIASRIAKAGEITPDDEALLDSTLQYRLTAALLPLAIRGWEISHRASDKIYINVRQFREPDAKITGMFDIKNPYVIDSLHSEVARSINQLKGVTDRDALFRTIEDASLEGLNPRKVASRIAETVTGPRLQQRALTIARTETLRAVNGGQRHHWGAMREAGILNATVMKRWIVTPDDRLDEEICAPMAKQTVPVDGKFLTPEGESLDNPPAHPNCRCAMRLIYEGEATRLEDVISDRGIKSDWQRRNFTEDSWLDDVAELRRHMGDIPLDIAGLAERGFTKVPRFEATQQVRYANALNAVGDTIDRFQKLPASVQAAVKPARIVVEPNMNTNAIARTRTADGQVEVIVSNPYWLDPTGRNKDIYQQGWWPVGGDPVMHELGHVPATAGGLQLWPNKTSQNVGKQVSAYAATGPPEFMAETWSGLAAGNQYSSEVMELYQAWGGKIP